MKVDFRNQNDVEKMSDLCTFLKSEFSIISYGYTARSDLQFNHVSFIIRGSGFFSKNGKTTVIPKNQKRPENFVICPDIDCGNKCKLCMREQSSNGKLINIAFVKH